MTLSNIFLQRSLGTLPPLKSPYGWLSYNLQDLAIYQFGDFKSAIPSNGLRVYAGSPGASEEDIRSYIQSQFSTIDIRTATHYSYPDGDKDKGYTPGLDTKLADIWMFISADGASLLEAHKHITENKTIKENEIALFLELPDGDFVSEKILRVAAGSKAQKYASEIMQAPYINGIYSLKDNEVRQLLSSLENKNTFLQQLVQNLLKTHNIVKDIALDKIIEFVEWWVVVFAQQARLDEKRWNKEHTDYSLKGDSNYKQELKEWLNEMDKLLDGFEKRYDHLPFTISALVTSVRETKDFILAEIDTIQGAVEDIWAYMCGLWNGLMDLISCIVVLIKLLFQGIKVHNQYKQNQAYYNALALEYIDNVLAALLAIDNIGGLLKSGFFQYLRLMLYLAKIPEKLRNELIKLNSTELSYYEGYITFNLIEWLLPPLKLARIARVEKVVAVLDDMLSAVTKVQKTLPDNAAGNVVDIFFNMVKGLSSTLAKGSDEVFRMMNEIYDAITKWIDELISLKKVDDIPPLSEAELDWMAVTKELDDFGGKVLSKGKLKKLRKTLRRKNIVLILEDDVAAVKKLFKPVVINNILFENVDDMFRYMRNKQLVGGFDVRNMQMILPKKYNPVTRAFQNPSELVVFHEMAHVKHFETIGAGYYGLSELAKETYVWNQIYRKRKKWTKAEIELSLWNVNKARTDLKLSHLKIE